MNKAKKIDLGFMKVEHHIDTSKQDRPKFIKIEHHKEPYKPTLESNINIDVLPKSMEHLAKEEEAVKPKLHKPKKFSKLLREINVLFDNMIIFNTLLMAIIIFLSSYMVLSVLGINIIFSIIPPIIYISIYLFIELRKNKYLMVENRFENLNEKIRTAADNIYSENPIVDELRQEVSRDIKAVDYASFFSEKRTSYKVLLIILLCFGVLFLAQYDVEFKLDLEKAWGFIQGGEGEAGEGIFSDIISAATGGKDTDIFGEEYLAELGEEKMTISMNRVGYEINMEDVKDPGDTEFEDSLFPPDIGLEESEGYIPPDFGENREIIKNYFRSMAQD